jgi:PhnB protein
MTKLNPYLNFAGNAEEAFNFYQSIFGGDFTSVVRFKDMPMEGVTLSDADQDKIIHIGLPIGDGQVLMASDVVGPMLQQFQRGNSCYISVHPESRQEADRIFNGLSAGGEIEMPIGDQVWGDYYGSFKDKFGVWWMVNYSQQQG